MDPRNPGVLSGFTESQQPRTILRIHLESLLQALIHMVQSHPDLCSRRQAHPSEPRLGRSTLQHHMGDVYGSPFSAIPQAANLLT